ncbi:MAG: 2-isopropylmalate synthase, partial [Polyangiaceae bacterium]|nr:2-isopropylmalate synthase [Polyangiaceae bacterium]
AEAIRPAKHGRIHTFLATSPIHREHKLRMTKAEVLAKVSEMVRYARSHCADIEFSPEDAGRTEMEFLYEVLAAAIEAGATTLNIPDTVGYTLPHEFGERIALLKQNVPGIDDVIISVHCHNDLGLATANSLAGILGGARQVEVAVNGIGERAGNTSLEEIVMALHTRRAAIGLSTGIDTTQLTRASKLVSTVTGMVVQPNKAIVGANAFAHESGIHQDGMLKHEETYEIMRPETVGAARTHLVLGKHSGKHALQNRLAELGYALEGEGLGKAFESFKKLADKKKIITDADLVALFSDGLQQELAGRFSLIDLQVVCGSMGLPTATVRLHAPNDEVRTEVAVGTGPVDAAFKAVQKIVCAPATLLEYSVSSVTRGIDALGEVSVRIEEVLEDDAAPSPQKINPQHGGSRPQVFHGHGAETDIIVASAKAY